MKKGPVVGGGGGVGAYRSGGAVGSRGVGGGLAEKTINLQVDSTCSSWQLVWWGWGHLTSIYLQNKVGGKGFLPSFVIKQAKPS